MFCEKCGAKNDGSNKFCEKCGNKFETEVNTPKKVQKNEKTSSIKDKINALSKKQKIIGGVVSALLVILIVFYIVGSKMTSLETIGSKAFEELASNSKINDKYLSVPLGSKDYFISLGDTMKNEIKNEEIDFDYSDYTVTASSKKITIKYKENDKKETYKVVFKIKQSGKSLLVFDKYVITKITVQTDDYDYTTLYDPENVEKLTLTTVKDSKISIDGKELDKSYLDSKKSDEDNDVYVVKGISNGDYKVKITIGKLEFERKVYVSSKADNEYDLTNYISSSYLVDDKEFLKTFKTYISTYYENVNDTSKTIDDFSKKYKINDSIKESFASSKESATNVASFKIDEVTLRSLYYYSSDKELSVTYKVNYTYKLNDSDSEKTNYKLVKVTYDLSDVESPIELSYMPY